MASVIISRQTRPRPIYGFNKKTDGNEVTDLVINIRKGLGASEMNKVMIYILSGTSGDIHGNLVGEDDFYQEEKLRELQTVRGVRVNERTPAITFTKYFEKTNSILILAWSYSYTWQGLAKYNK